MGKKLAEEMYRNSDFEVIIVDRPANASVLPGRTWARVVKIRRREEYPVPSILSVRFPEAGFDRSITDSSRNNSKDRK